MALRSDVLTDRLIGASANPVRAQIRHAPPSPTAGRTGVGV